MRSLAPVARYVLWLLCAVIVVTRVSGAHVHLCFDGTEPLVSVHAEEGRLDFDHERSRRGHSDLEVSLSANTLVNKAFIAGTLPVAVSITIVCLLCGAFAASKIGRPRSSPVPLSWSFLLRPPLRGPPL